MESDMQEFLKQIASVLEVEVVLESDKLTAFEQLDSLGVLSLIAMLDARYGVSLSTTDIGRMNTIGDLWKYIQCASLQKGIS